MCFFFLLQFSVFSLVIFFPVSYVIAVGILLYANDFHFRRKYCKSTAKLNGKTVVVTGGNSGLGFETAKELANRGARVILVCRNAKKAQKACDDIKDSTGNTDVTFMQCDLTDLDSVQQFCLEFTAKEDHLHILVNNAGIAENPTLTKQHYDGTVGANYIGPFLLTHLLMDKIKESAPSRIINISSIGHVMATDLSLKEIDEKGQKFPEWQQYMKSKLLNILHIRELARRLEGSGVTTYSIHPGFIFTSLFEKVKSESVVAYHISRSLKWCALTAYQGAQTSIFCAVDESLSSSSGKYYWNCSEKPPSKLALDNDLARRVYDVTLKSLSEYVDTKVE